MAPSMAFVPRLFPKSQLRRIATESRRLAFQCVTGTAPGFNPYSFGACALAVVGERAKLKNEQEEYPIGVYLEELVPEGALVTISLFPNQVPPGSTTQQSAAFPLLAYADAVGALAREST